MLKLKKNIEQILNEQIEKEFYSSNLYLSMSVWATTNGYEGCGKWLADQAAEEYGHMQRILNHMIERGSTPVVPALQAPPVKFKNITEIFEKSLEHEQFVTKSIYAIADLAKKESDLATQGFIVWFIKEQVEEEASVEQILAKLKLAGDKNLYFFDKDIMSLRD